MSKSAIIGIIIVIIIALAALFFVKNQKSSAPQIETQPFLNTATTINNSVQSLDTSTDYENNGNIQQDLQSIDADISVL